MKKQNSYLPFHPKVKTSEVDLNGIDFTRPLEQIILDMRPKFEMGKEYSFLAASVLAEHLRLETLTTLGMTPTVSGASENEKQRAHLRDYIDFAIKQGHVNPRMREFDLDALDARLRPDRNYLFDYLGAHTLYDRYLLHVEGKRYEGFQYFWMRVAMGVALAETNPLHATSQAAEFYDCISQLFYVPSTPTLFNAGTQRSQMSSCFLTTTQDDLTDIYRQFSDNALLSKFAGGLGNDWTKVRASGSWIKGTNGRSQGVIPFLKVQDSSTVAVNQGGKRKGAVCAYLETWHLDVEDFLELRKNTGDERRRTHDMNTANWVPDLFLERVEQNADWTLMCPSEAPDLHELYGEAFKKRYTEYEAKAARGEMKNTKKVSALTLWRKMLTMLFETGHPWITFKDPCNIRSTQKHTGVVHSSNLCTEITLNTGDDETAVCNIGSVNLRAIFSEPHSGEVLAKTVRTAMRMLDNVITENFYPIASAKNANERHRPVGLGLMGFQDVLYMKRVPYSSPAATALSAKIMEHISFNAIKASADLANERGAYASFQGSAWSQGKVPQDTLSDMGAHVKLPEIPTSFTNAQGQNVSCDTLWQNDGLSQPLAWNELRSQVARGMRNSLCMAIAPTATISNIAGCTQSIEPTYKNLYVKTNLGGDYTVVNEYLLEDLRKLGMWNTNLSRELKRADGDISTVAAIPDELKALYQTAFDIEPEQLIRCASARQMYIDQAQSLNLYLGQPSGRRIDEMYRYAWHAGLKTTYYLRARAATRVEKSSVNEGSTATTTNLNAAVQAAVKSVNAASPGPLPSMSSVGMIQDERDLLSTGAKACSIENPDCEACQ